MLSEQEKSWLAAIIEGEGCLMLTYERRTPKGRDFQAVFTTTVVTVCNTNPYLIRAVSELWKRLNMRFHYTWSRQNGQSEALTIVCNSVGSCAKLLREIRPYLRTKHVEADIMLEYAQYRESLIKKRGPDGGYKDYIDKTYVEELIRQHKKAKHLIYDMSRISRKANEILDLSELRSSETLRETQSSDDKVRADQ